jgi:hypothetical protein
LKIKSRAAWLSLCDSLQHPIHNRQSIHQGS